MIGSINGHLYRITTLEKLSSEEESELEKLALWATLLQTPKAYRQTWVPRMAIDRRSLRFFRGPKKRMTGTGAPPTGRNRFGYT